MLFLKVLAALALLILLLCLLQLGVRASWGTDLRVTAILGPVRLPLIPQKEKKPKKDGRPPKKPGGEKRKKPKKERKPLPKPGREDLREALRLLLPALKKSLRKLGRGIRVEPLRISLTLAGKNDPADAAEKYGCLQAAMWTVMPQLQRWMRIPDPRIHTGVDFDAERTDFSGEAAVTFRLGTLFAMGFALLIPAVKWFRHYRKRHRDDDTKEMNPPQRAEEPPETAA